MSKGSKNRTQDHEKYRKSKLWDKKKDNKQKKVSPKNKEKGL